MDRMLEPHYAHKPGSVARYAVWAAQDDPARKR